MDKTKDDNGTRRRRRRPAVTPTQRRSIRALTICKLPSGVPTFITKVVRVRKFGALTVARVRVFDGKNATVYWSDRTFDSETMKIRNHGGGAFFFNGGTKKWERTNKTFDQVLAELGSDFI